MSQYVKCEEESCNNLTSNYESIYGAFCFLHSKNTKCNKSKNFEIVKYKLPEKVELLSQRPKSPKKYKLSSRIKCINCDIEKSATSKMECNHLVCKECLDKVRSDKCP